MAEYFNNVSKNYKLDYNNINEKTGYDAAKFLVDVFYDNNVDRFQMNRKDKKESEIKFPVVYVHSANPIGASNIKVKRVLLIASCSAKDPITDGAAFANDGFALKLAIAATRIVSRTLC